MSKVRADSEWIPLVSEKDVGGLMCKIVSKIPGTESKPSCENFQLLSLFNLIVVCFEVVFDSVPKKPHLPMQKYNFCSGYILAQWYVRWT